MREIILDTETTGLDPKMGHRLVEIGAVELITHQRLIIKLTKSWRDVDPGAQEVHGLTMISNNIQHSGIFLRNL